MINTQYEKLSTERKFLQQTYQAPDWLSTAGYQLLKGKHYLNTNETPRTMYERIASRAAQLTNLAIPFHYGYSTWYDAFFDVMYKGWLSPSTPVLTNMGNDRGHPIACSGSHVNDSIRSFYQTRTELAQLTQRGYGTSVCLDTIRPRGALISTGGHANGVMQFASGVVDDMHDISQGSSRRGSCGMYISPLHPDFDEIIDQLMSDDDGWNIGWNIGDDFEQLFITDPARADLIWKKMLRVKMIKGKGYFFFIDKVNRANPLMYKDKKFTVKASNLCVTGDTKILTKDYGYVPIQNLVGRTLNCWNGIEWSPTPIFQTSEGQSVLTVTLSNQSQIEATPYHKWYVMDGYSKVIEKRTNELQQGDKLIKFELEPIPHGSMKLPLAYVNGFHSGDGTVYKESNKSRISLHDSKQLLLNRFSGYYASSYTKDGRILNLQYKTNVLEDKFYVPNNDININDRLLWLAGYIDADGTLTNNAGTESIQVASIELEFIKKVMLLLQEIGIHSTISKVRDAGYTELPANDGSGSYKDYWTKAVYRLLIPGSELNKLIDLGFSPSRVIPTKRDYQRQARQFVQVVSVVDYGKVVPTYCGTEPKYNKLMFNGVLTGNCSEITLMSDEDHSFTCVLSSLNIAKYDEWKNTKTIEISMVFLDAVIEDMLIKARQEEGFERVIAFTEKSRAVGLGVLGLSTYYQKQLWPFGSFESMQFNNKFFKELNDRTLAVSKYLASVLGEPEWLVGYGERFSHRLALPPTMSTSIIQEGVSQGIEPVYANVYEQDMAGGSVYRINPVFLDLMKSRGQYNVETMRRIAEDQGSVQGEDWLTDHEKLVFRTAFEINQETILIMGSQRQRWVDQGQSLNLYFTSDAEEEEISRLHHIALTDPYIKALYYVRSLNGVAKHKVDTSECLACHG